MAGQRSASLRIRVPLAAALLGFAHGCEPALEAGWVASDAGPPQTDLPYVAPAAAPAALPARVWRLNHAEYARSVRAFVGVDPDTSAFESELDNGIFPNMSSAGIVRVNLARDYYESAEHISDAVSVDQLSALAGGQLTAASKSTFIATAVERAFRRPATQDDIRAYGELFDAASDAVDDGTAAYRAVIRALLASPFFLYRTELGSAAVRPAFELTGHEIASLLSYSLQGGPPGSALLRAAASGELNQPATLARHVEDLLATPEALSTLTRFLTQWLRLEHFDRAEKDVLLFPGFAAIRPAMQAEAEDFLTQRGSMDGTLAGLLTAPVSPSGALAAYYASDPSAGGEVGERVGVLGLGAVVAARSRFNISSPTFRGLFVRERFLCQDVHLPPDTVPDIVNTLFGKMPRTTRELYELHAAEPSCAGCHALLDGIGITFEDIDAAGRFRKLENNVPIDTRGALRNADVSAQADDRGQLVQGLADSTWVRECVVRQAFRFYFGQVETDRGLGPVQLARGALSSGTFRDMLLALMTSPSTWQRVRR